MNTALPLLREIVILIVIGLLLSPSAFAQTPAPAARGLGPFVVETARGESEVRLLRRDKKVVWVLQRLRSGQDVETGMPKAEMLRVRAPRPRVFESVASATAEQAAALRPQFEQYIRSYQAYRDLPGMNVDEAQVLLGRLHEAASDWAAAAAAYAEVTAQPHQPPEAAVARLRLGLCRVRAGAHKLALDDLDPALAPEDDVELVSDVYLARGEAMQALGRHEEAVMALLHWVVFHPYVRDNEARAWGAVLPSYAALKDWDAAFKTVQSLRERHPQHEAAKKAEAFAQEHAEHFQAEAAFRGEPEPVNEGGDDEDKG